MIVNDSIVGFHGQQAVEKYLKAVLAARGIPFRRSHDLAELLDVLADHHLPPPPHSATLDELNPYAVEARHGLTDPQNLDRFTLLSQLIDVRRWAQACVADS